MDEGIIKLKKLIKMLKSYSGSTTSLITLILPPKSRIADYQSLLLNEYGTASNIKSRVNRQSVLDAITYAQAHLKLYSHHAPDNGLFLVSGNVTDEHGKAQKITIGIEPIRPVTTSLYRCDNRFHTEELEKMLVDDHTYGFIIVDGESCLYATYCGNVKNILYKFTVELPPKHGRGGQSALRFARHRTEAQDNYIRKVSENANNLFIDKDTNLVNVEGIIFGGSADFKERISTSDILDPRIKKVILGVYDIQYGGQNGLDQAITLASDVLSNVKFVQERKIVTEFLDEIALNTSKYIFGKIQTMKALNDGLIKKLIVDENYNDDDLDIILESSVIKNKTTELHIISNNTTEGTQFCHGFGGLGGILHYPIEIDYENDIDNDFDVDIDDLGL